MGRTKQTILSTENKVRRTISHIALFFFFKTPRAVTEFVRLSLHELCVALTHTYIDSKKSAKLFIFLLVLAYVYISITDGILER